MSSSIPCNNIATSNHLGLVQASEEEVKFLAKLLGLESPNDATQQFARASDRNPDKRK